MNRRFFIKSLLFFLSSLSFKILASNKKGSVSFDYGVASGDPTNNQVILWTKITTENPQIHTVIWEVSDDTSFNKIIASGFCEAKPFDDYTVNVDASIPSEFNA